MKRIFVICALASAILTTSCEKRPVQIPQPRDPSDVSGVYEVDYTMSIDGEDVLSTISKGRVEASGKLNEQFRLYFYPGTKIPLLEGEGRGNYIPLGTLTSVENGGSHIFQEYKSWLTFEMKEKYEVIGNLTMNGSIVPQAEGKWGVGADLPNAGPGVHGRVNLTIDVSAPLPEATKVNHDTGEGVRKYHIEITGK